MDEYVGAFDLRNPRVSTSIDSGGRRHRGTAHVRSAETVIVLWRGRLAVQAKDYVVLRAIEVAIAAFIAIALVLALNSGWLAAGAQRFSDWYASQVDGLLNITVVSTTVTLPQVERTDLPIPQVEPRAFSATRENILITPSSNAD